MSSAIIFHHPLEITDDSTRGSSLRPAQMLRAFEELGYEVAQVTGRSPVRARRAHQLLDDISKGRRFDFVYGESATTPNALSDPSHLPRHPLLDARFLRSVRRSGVPVGVFYRDVYWRFDEYKRATSIHKRALALAFYRFDLIAYRLGCDVIFLPSLAMGGSLRWAATDQTAFVALPPGGERRAKESTRIESSDRLRLLYVGGVTPPLYDLRPLIAAVAREPGAHLTICCREEERESLPDIPTNVDVVHRSGPDLDALYASTDLAMVLFGPHPYRDFAVPVKLFEAISHGVPTVADRSTAAGAIVQSDHLGPTIGRLDELPALLARLSRDRGAVAALRESVRARQADHTWLARARTASEALSSIRTAAQ